jgi:uncharacterized membrane protein YphA (DoxX/SURF4 family)
MINKRSMIVLKTLGERLEYYAPTVLRIGMAAIFLWFGIAQVMSPGQWTSQVPEIIAGFAENTELTVFLAGIAEIILGGMLLLGVLTRIVSWILVALTAVILSGIGYNSDGVMAFSMLIGMLTVAMTRNDPLRIDNRIRWGKKKDPISFD